MLSALAEESVGISRTSLASSAFADPMMQRRMSTSESALCIGDGMHHHYSLLSRLRGAGYMTNVGTVPPSSRNDDTTSMVKIMTEQQVTAVSSMPPPPPPQSLTHRLFGGDLITNFAPVNWLFRHRLSDAKDDLARESVLESIKY